MHIIILLLIGVAGKEHPTARGFHSATATGSSVYFFGGSSGFSAELMCVTRFSNDLFKLDLVDKQVQVTPPQLHKNNSSKDV